MHACRRHALHTHTSACHVHVPCEIGSWVATLEKGEGRDEMGGSILPPLSQSICPSLLSLSLFCLLGCQKAVCDKGTMRNLDITMCYRKNPVPKRKEGGEGTWNLGVPLPVCLLIWCLCVCVVLVTQSTHSTHGSLHESPTAHQTRGGFSITRVGFWPFSVS